MLYDMCIKLSKKQRDAINCLRIYNFYGIIITDIYYLGKWYKTNDEELEDICLKILGIM